MTLHIHLSTYSGWIHWKISAWQTSGILETEWECEQGNVEYILEYIPHISTEKCDGANVEVRG